MGDAPERIWTFEYSNGAIPRSGDWIDEKAECPEGSPCYILETEVAKLIADAVAAERDFWVKLSSELVDKIKALEAAAIRSEATK